MTLCGTSIDGEMQVVAMDARQAPTLCVVCHAAPVMKCNTCGEEIPTMPIKLGTALPKEIAVFDLETTGVDLEEARIVTAFIGVMNVASREMTERWTWLLDPGVEIPKAASDVHGVTTERARSEGSDAKRGVFDIAQRLDALDKRGLTIVIMNAPFDLTILDRELLRHWPKMRPLFDVNDAGKLYGPTIFDPMVLDRAVSDRGGSRKLVDLAKFYGVPVEENAHDAEADCRMAGRVAIELFGLSRLADMTLQQVHDKLIPTHRNNANGLADFWSQGKGAAARMSPEERVRAIADVRAGAGLWPMRPRPATAGESPEKGAL